MAKTRSTQTSKGGGRKKVTRKPPPKVTKQKATRKTPPKANNQNDSESTDTEVVVQVPPRGSAGTVSAVTDPSPEPAAKKRLVLEGNAPNASTTHNRKGVTDSSRVQPTTVDADKPPKHKGETMKKTKKQKEFKLGSV